MFETNNPIVNLIDKQAEEKRNRFVSELEEIIVGINTNHPNAIPMANVYLRQILESEYYEPQVYGKMAKILELSPEMHERYSSRFESRVWERT